MPTIVGEHNSSQVFAQVVLLPVDRFEDTLDPQWLGKPSSFHVLDALIDTGAQATSITAKAAKKLDLEPSGMMPIQGVSGPQYHPYYIFKIGFVDLQVNELGFKHPKIHLLEREITGPEFDCGTNADFDVLLGMDVLSIGTLIITDKGSFQFIF